MVEQHKDLQLLLSEPMRLVPMITIKYGVFVAYISFTSGPILKDTCGLKQDLRAELTDGNTYADFVAMAVKPGGFTPFVPHPEIRHEFILPGYTLTENGLLDGATITHCSLDFAYAAPEENSAPFTSCRGKFETIEELLQNPKQPKGAYHERHNHHGLQNRTNHPQLWLAYRIEPGKRLTSVDLRLMELVGGAKEFVCPVDEYGVPTGTIPTLARVAEGKLIRSLLPDL